MFPFIFPLKMFAEFDAEKLYGVDPPKIVILELCPAKMETEFWLSDSAPVPVVADELTLAVKDAQLPA